MLNISYTHEKFPPHNVEVTFLNEFMVIIYTSECTEGPPEFTLFDTSVSQDHPTNFQRFRLPLEYCGWRPSVTLDIGTGLGILNHDEPLIVDPTQALVLLNLSSDGASTSVFVVLRIQALVEQVCLMGTDTHIPWRELERDAVVVEASTSDSNFYIHGVHVIEETRHSTSFDGIFPMYVHVFDFSRRGCSAFRDVDDETVRAAWREGRRDFTFEQSGDIVDDVFGALGNGTFSCLVRGFQLWKVHER